MRLSRPRRLRCRLAADSTTNVVALWDNDQDGTLDLTEINKAAGAEFDKLDVDHDGTLDMKEGSSLE